MATITCGLQRHLTSKSMDSVSSPHQAPTPSLKLQEAWIHSLLWIQIALMILLSSLKKNSRELLRAMLSWSLSGLLNRTMIIKLTLSHLRRHAVQSILPSRTSVRRTLTTRCQRSNSSSTELEFPMIWAISLLTRVEAASLTSQLFCLTLQVHSTIQIMTSSHSVLTTSRSSKPSTTTMILAIWPSLVEAKMLLRRQMNSQAIRP